MNQALNLELRPATPQDLPAVLALIRQLADYEKLSHQVVATEAQLHEAMFGPSAVAETLLACLDGQTVGMALCFRSYSTFLGRAGLYLEDLFVLPEHRGLGIGRRLLQALATLAVQRGYGRMEWSVLDWNQPAIGFYQRLGARPVDGWTVYRLSGEALEALAAAAPKQGKTHRH